MTGTRAAQPAETASPGIAGGHARRSGGRFVIDSILGIRAILATTPARWLDLAGTLAESELTARPPQPGSWSAIECLQHLIEAERLVFPVRLQAILEGRDFEAYDPDAAGAMADVPGTLPELATVFAELRAESTGAVSGLLPEHLELTARHAELGIVSMRQLLNQWAGHDLMHTVQGERALMQPFIAGSGPWRPYFADHDAGLREAAAEG
jgi:hypothetical protein